MHTYTHTHTHTHTHTKQQNIHLKLAKGDYQAGVAAEARSARAGLGWWARTPWSEVPAQTDTACVMSLPPSVSHRCSCTSLTHHRHQHYNYLCDVCLLQYLIDVPVPHWHITDINMIPWWKTTPYIINMTRVLKDRLVRGPLTWKLNTWLPTFASV